MPLSDFDRECVDQILAGYGDWFTAKLMRLIAHADSSNREKLRTIFPEEVELVENYQNNPLGDED